MDVETVEPIGSLSPKSRANSPPDTPRLSGSPAVSGMTSSPGSGSTRISTRAPGAEVGGIHLEQFVEQT